MPSFGEKLKQEREQRKITLEQISISTKIGTRMLQALEEDRFNQLPGGIFNKGFVRAYARCVGLDEDQTVAEYLEASGDAPPASTEIAPREDGGRDSAAREDAETISRLEAISDSPRRQMPWGLFAALLLLIALALSLWSHRRREQARETVRESVRTTSPIDTTTTAVPPPVSPASDAVPDKAVSDRPALDKNASPSAPTTAATTTTTAPAATVAPNPQNLAPAPSAAPGEFSIDVHCREESWVLVTIDGKTLPSEILYPGSQRNLRAQRQIIVKTGNAGGVDFRFNGTKIDSSGQLGEVKTLTFGPQGLLPNAPTLPATP